MNSKTLSYSSQILKNPNESRDNKDNISKVNILNKTDEESLEVTKNTKIKGLKDYLLNTSSESIESVSENEISQNILREYYQENSFDEDSIIPDRNFTTQINEAFDYLHYALLKDNDKIRSEKDKIESEQEVFNKEISDQINHYKKDLNSYNHNNSLIVDNILCKSHEIIELDVNGQTKILTSIKTLIKQPNSKLAKTILAVVGSNIKKGLSFNSSIKNIDKLKAESKVITSNCGVKYSISNFTQLNKNSNCYNAIIPQKISGKYFVEREVKPFTNMIYYLRNNLLPYFTDKNDETKFIQELEFWNITYKKPNDFHLFYFDPDWCASTLLLEKNSSIVEKHDGQHGIVFTKQKLDHEICYIEFKINIKIASSGTSHLFLGLVDKSKYKPEFLSKLLFNI